MNSTPGWRALFLGVVLVSLGCRVGPEHCVPATDVPPSWCASTDESIAVAGPVDECWWNAFEDPDLARMVWQARGQNLTLQQAAARIEEARAMRGVARSGLFPEVSGVTSYTLSKISNNGNAFGFAVALPPFNFWSAGFDASWEVDLFGRVHRTLEAADADIAGSIERHNSLLVTLIGDVAANYVNVRILQERIRFAEENDRLQRETLRITENRLPGRHRQRVGRVSGQVQPATHSRPRSRSCAANSKSPRTDSPCCWEFRPET